MACQNGCMNTLTFDTLRFIERLKAAGISQEHAVAEAEALRDVLSEALNTTLATKADVAEVRMELSAVKTELKSDILEVKNDVRLLAAHMDTKFALVDGKFDKLNWMFGAIVAIACAAFAKQFV